MDDNRRLTTTWPNISELSREKLERFIPPFLRKAPMESIRCTLTANYDERKNVTHYKYKIVWYEKINVVDQRNDVHNFNVSGRGGADQWHLKDRSPHGADQTRKDLNSIYCGVTASDESTVYENQEFNDDTVFESGETKEENELLCDGPCRRAVAPQCLHHLGRCGHYLCPNCRGIVWNPDGTDGCSSFACYRSTHSFIDAENAHRAYDYYIATERKKSESLSSPHSPAKAGAIQRLKLACSSSAINVGETKVSLSSIHGNGEDVQQSLTSTNEVVSLRLTVIEPGPHQQNTRHHYEAEVQANETVLDALRFVLPDGKQLRKLNESGRMFHVHTSSMGPVRMHKEIIEETCLYEFPTRKGNIKFLIDFTNTVRYRKRYKRKPK